MGFLLVFDAVALGGCASSVPSPKTPATRLAPTDRVQAVRPLAEQTARRFGLEPSLVLGVIHVESRFDPEARSSVGAVGLMQLMPGTAAALARRLGRVGEPIQDPSFNLEAGCLYLSLLLDRFDGRLDLALAAYNTGPYRVDSWRSEGRSLPAYSQRYVNAVLSARKAYAQGPDSLEGGAGRSRPDPPPAAAVRRIAEPDRQALRALLRRQQEQFTDRQELRALLRRQQAQAEPGADRQAPASGPASPSPDPAEASR